jgi:hypothetical protein
MTRMNRVLAGHQYVANFLDAPVRLGMIYRMDDEQFLPAIHFNDAFPELDLRRFADVGSEGSIKFSQAKDVSIAFGASASTKLGKSEVRLSFKRSKSVAGVIQNAAIESLRYENVLPQLQELWTERGYAKFRREYVFVFEVVTAASGTVIYSQDAKNEVVLSHALGAPVTKLADLGSGQFEYVSNTKRTLEIIRAVAHKPLFKAFWLRGNWEPEVLG